MSVIAPIPQVPTKAPTTVIVGLGATGFSIARYLEAQGVAFSVLDSRENPPNLAEFRRSFPTVSVSVGRLIPNVLNEADRILLSPGVTPDEPALAAARAAGAEVIGDIELFARSVNAPVLAVTGSNGKSTVTSLVGEMARHSGRRVAVGGNLGVPALDLLHPSVELYVLELSSFQLEVTHSLRPLAATILNISADHLDRHKTLENYSAAKRRIFNGEGVMVINADDPIVLAMADPDRPSVRFTLNEPVAANEYGVRAEDDTLWLTRGNEPLLRANEMRMQGTHNIANALAALALGTAAKLPLSAMLETLRTFAGLPHRCQWVAQRAGVDWYDDSKGTNVGATVAAIVGLGRDRRLVLLAGGDGKGQDFRPLAKVAKDCVRGAVLIGRDAPNIAQVLDGLVPVVHARTMAEAVTQAAALALPGDAVLLSPACASLDMFTNYVERAQVFVACVRELPPA